MSTLSLIDQGVKAIWIVERPTEPSQGRKLLAACGTVTPRSQALSRLLDPDWGVLDCLVAYLAPPGTSSAFIHLDSSNDLTERDRSVFQLVLPHLRTRRENARARRRLATALDTLARDEVDGVGVILLDQNGDVTFTSSAASRLIRRHFGSSGERLPEAIERWRENGRETPLVIQQDSNRPGNAT